MYDSIDVRKGFAREAACGVTIEGNDNNNNNNIAFEGSIASHVMLVFNGQGAGMPRVNGVRVTRVKK